MLCKALLTRKTPKTSRTKFWVSKWTRFRLIASLTCFGTRVIFSAFKSFMAIFTIEGCTKKSRYRTDVIIMFVTIINVNHLRFLGQGWCFKQIEFGRRLSVNFHHILGVNGVLNEFIFTRTTTFISLQTDFFSIIPVPFSFGVFCLTIPFSMFLCPDLTHAHYNRASEAC